MEWLRSYRQHIAGEKPIPLLLMILKIFWGLRIVCFGLAILVLGFGVWTALTADMRLGASMGLIVYPGAAIFISVLGLCIYAVAQLFLAPAPQKS